MLPRIKSWTVNLGKNGVNIKFNFNGASDAIDFYDYLSDLSVTCERDDAPLSVTIYANFKEEDE